MLTRKRQFCGKVFPSGDFSLGYDIANYSVEKRKSQEYDRIHALQFHDLLDEDRNTWMQIPLDVAQAYCPSKVIGQEEKLNLGLSTIRNQRNRPSRYGAKGITADGKRKVKSAAVLLERLYGKRKLTFATFTLPPMDEIFRRYVHENWGYLVKRIMEDVKRKLARYRVCSDTVAVTEIQEKRYAKTGEIYLHLHCVWVGGDGKGKYYVSANEARDILARVLRNMGKKCQQEMEGHWEAYECNCQASVDLQRVKKSVAAYLGKYLSKGTSLRGGMDDEQRLRYFPRQWWHVSAPLRKAVLDSIVKLTHEECDAIANDWQVRQRIVAWCKEIYLELGDRRFFVGVTGMLRRGWEGYLAKIHSAKNSPIPNEAWNALASSTATWRAVASQQSRV